MARYRGSITKRARNCGTALDGYPKTESIRRQYPSGQHGQGRKKLSEYALQMREKQRIKWTYGMQEKQFRKLYEASTRKVGVTGTVLLQTLESRFDNILYRSGLVKSRPQARQLIVHGHFEVNGKRLDIPSYRMKEGDVITVREKSKASIKATVEGLAPVVPHWIEANADKQTATLKQMPEREDIDSSFNEQLVIEFYSR